VKKLSCQEVLDQLWEYLDEDAREELCAEINAHLNGCGQCSFEVQSIRRTILIYRTDDAGPFPVQLSDRLRDALDRAYREPRDPK